MRGHHAHGAHGFHRHRRIRGAPLHRRLFFWFGVSILLMGAVASAVMWLAGAGGAGAHEMARVKAFVAGRYAAVWADPGARAELTTALARDLGLGVRLEARDGSTLAEAGPACAQHTLDVTVTDGPGTVLGTVHACQPRSPGPPTFFLALLAAGATLWLASLAVARRIGRPLRDLAGVAREIGEGRLQSRARLGWHQPGEVGALAESINEMASRIEKQLADQRELVAAVSHEIRAPLTRLRMLVELLHGKEADDATLAKLEREIVEIDALVGDLLASSRLDFSMLSVRELDASELATEALERAGLPAARLSVATTSPTLQGDATLLARALANLLDNAARHGGGATRLAVRDEGPDALAFDVEDEGPGFPEGMLTRAFEPFQRGHVERRGSSSLGLGLALVRRIAEAHGGGATAENRPGGGARVVFRLSRRGPTPR
jgi:two-component system, OmpR family, sensor kinase